MKKEEVGAGELQIAEGRLQNWMNHRGTETRREGKSWGGASDKW